MHTKRHAVQCRHWWTGEIASPELKFLLDHNSFETAIDVGCGDGALLYALRALGYLDSFTEIWAVDLSEDRLRTAQTISDAIRIVQDDAQDLTSVPSKHFDLVMSIMVIEHVAEDNRMVHTLSRICRPGGIIYLETVFKRSYGWYFFKNRHGKWALDPTHEREYGDDRELLCKIEHAGLRTVYSHKTPLYFPAVDFFINRLGIRDVRICERPFVRAARKVKVPIVGYFCWKMLLVR